MKRQALLTALTLLALAAPAAGQDADQDKEATRQYGDAFAAAAEAIAPAVVRLGPFVASARAPRRLAAIPGAQPGGKPKAPAKKARWTSAGVIVGEDHILTSLRGLGSGAEAKSVPLQTGNGVSAEASILARDPFRDLVLLRCDGIRAKAKAPAVPWGDDGLEVGRFLVAVGRPPLGPEHSVHVGIVSARRRFRQGFLQSDARTHRGVLGGPVLDLKGRVVGVVVKPRPEPQEMAGVTFAVPASTITETVLPALSAGRSLEPPAAPFLGVYVDAEPRGAVIVSRSLPGSPAAAIGLIYDDQILDISGRPVRNIKSFAAILADHAPGDAVTILIRRGKERLRLKATLTKKP